MTEATTRTIVAVKFSWEKGDKTYDYFADFPVEVGQRIYVPTKRGEAKVEVVAIKTESEMASVAALRPVEDLRTDEEKQAKYPNGQRKFSEDRTLLDEKGNRSIFDDVDR
ncbi:hypothetical protein RJJ65_17645 [Rhizobium hidalgonense]|uniref:Primosomal protein N' 3' DNA-binding domain-containing protein n=1 Tax=Rhizobium hidalgonense TaxID=1538159 RepID=A0AAJ2GRC8_9HYPH|nr:hypothetical protein [Rhizobium hidalgonense]MDR9774455.1 hypothetical protein [Rhizobium hidalgonense]